MTCTCNAMTGEDCDCYPKTPQRPAAIRVAAPVVGEKWDTGKPTFWRALLRFPLAIIGAARAADYGFAKYCDGRGIPDDNWKHVPEFEKRYFDALLRHWCAIQRGETHDPESNRRHWDHFAWNANALAQMGHEKLDAEGIEA